MPLFSYFNFYIQNGMMPISSISNECECFSYWVELASYSP